MSWNIFCRSSKTDFKFSFYDTVDHINKEQWHKVVPATNMYLSLEYLQALERAMQDNIAFRYILFHNKQNKPVAAAVVQLLNFSGKGAFYQDLLGKAGVRITQKLPETLNVKVLVCGNIFTCGENGFAFSDGISGEEAHEVLANGLEKLKDSEKKNGAVSLVLLKEFWPQTFAESDVLKEENFIDFMVDVNMVLPIRKSWDTFEDYLESMTTKFRTKAKGVLRKSDGIIVADLSKEDIAKHKVRIEQLYNRVVEKATFNSGSLNGEAFANFKKNLKNDFIFKGYFLEKELVGFSTGFVFNNIVDANYVGIDYALNQQYALYPRMMYDLVELAISRKASELRMGRTAEEIKSSMGAEPVNMKLYIKHGNNITNKILKPIIQSITPGKFEFRKPFKHVQHVPSGSKSPLHLIK